MINNIQHFYCNSKYRLDNSTNENPNFSFDLTNKDINRATIQELIIPKTYYLIRSGYNDTFILNEDDTEVTITLNEGNYDLDQICAHLTSRLNALSPNLLVYTVEKYNWQVCDTGKIKYIVINPQNFIISLSIPNKTISNIYEILGFNSNSMNIFNENTLVTTNICNLNLENNIYVICDQVYNNSSGYGSNVITALQNHNSTYESYIQHDFSLLDHSVTINNNSNLFKFKLIDETNREISLNGIDWSFKITFFKYETNLYGLLKNFIKFNALKKK